LFAVRERWTAEDLSPFLSDVAIDNKRRDAMLLKFARSSQCQIPVAETKAERRARLHNGIAHPPTKTVQLYSSRLRYGAT
jgi:sister chromatid cohesion protein DCC1